MRHLPSNNLGLSRLAHFFVKTCGVPSTYLSVRLGSLLGFSSNCTQTRKSYNKYQKGFTLVELLVVISVIGLLASIVVVSLNGARKSGRDARAAGDLKGVQTALELYYDANNTFPIIIPENWEIIPSESGDSNLKKFLDPLPTGTGINNYYWCDGGNQAMYTLAAKLESGKVGSLTGNCYYVTEKGVRTGSACSFAATNCAID